MPVEKRKIGIYMDFENFYNGVLEFLYLNRRILVSKKIKEEGIIKFNTPANIERNFITLQEKEILSETLKNFFRILYKDFFMKDIYLDVKFIKAMGIFQNLPFYENFYIKNGKKLNLRQFLSYISVQPIIPFENAKNKNSSDIKLTIDFITDLGVYGRKSIDDVILVSGDSDLFPLYIWAMEHLNMKVYIATLKNRFPEFYDTILGDNLLLLDDRLILAFLKTLREVDLNSLTFFTSFWLYNLLSKLEEGLLAELIDEDMKDSIKNIKSHLKNKYEESLKILDKFEKEIKKHFNKNKSYFFYNINDFDDKYQILPCILIDDNFLNFLKSYNCYIELEELTISDNNKINLKGKIKKIREQNKLP